MNKDNDKRIENLFMNLKISEPYLARHQVQTIKDLRAVYKCRGYLDGAEMERLEALWRVAIMANGEVDND